MDENSLRNLVTQLINSDDFETLSSNSYDNDVQSGGDRFDYESVVPEFCNETNDEYRNCDSRVLNKIWIDPIGDHYTDKNIYEFLSDRNRNHDKKSIRYFDFIKTLKTTPQKILYLSAFFNEKRIYGKSDDCTECSLDQGVLVPKEKFSQIFKPAFVKKLESQKLDKFNAASGSGVKNLNKVAKTAKNDGFTYITLEAFSNGSELGNKLFSLYQKYGFNMYKTPFWEISDQGFKEYSADNSSDISEDEFDESTNALMYGHVDDIIKSTDKLIGKQSQLGGYTLNRKAKQSGGYTLNRNAKQSSGNARRKQLYQNLKYLDEFYEDYVNNLSTQS